MARQKGIIPITGTIDELTFYKHPDDGHLVKKKTGVTSERVKNDPDFKLTRLKAAEFKTAIHSGQLLRLALDKLLFPIADGKLSSRMNKEMVKVAQLDKVHRLGERVPSAGNLTTLEGFNFNGKLLLQDAFTVAYSVQYDVVSREMCIEVPGFKPWEHVHAPDYVEYFQLVSGTAVVNFAKKQFTNDLKKGPLLPFNKQAVDDVRFSHPAPLTMGQTLFAALGIVFYAPVEKIPKEAISQRKRWKVKARADKEGTTRFTGALSLVKVIAGEPEVNGQEPGDERQDDEWMVDGLGIA